MNPLVDEFLGGKSGLLVAMGPTGSGKTHTVFGSPRNPGIVPLTLQQIFSARDESKGGSQPTRSFCLSMFEILSEGKGEQILDLLSEAADLVLQQSAIKGLKEVTISNFTDAESLVSRGMLKRSTAPTNANSKSSRSQCIITLRAVCKNIDVESERSISSAVLTIADLAGAERERRTGNQGSRLLESNFINNTSMVFGLCLRSLLEHQKNQKKPLEKHFKNSMLTRYLRDYLEGRKKMTLVLNVKPGDDDYLDTSFLLRQASPYMKIKYTSLEDSSDFVSQKRSNVSLICQENKKKRKVHKPEVLAVEGKDNIDKDDDIKVSERDEAQYKFLNSELRRVSRSEEIMKNFSRALWTVLKQYKQKLSESENAAESMRELLRDKDIQIMELKRDSKVLNSSCSCEKFPIAEDTSVEQNDALCSGQAARSLVSLSDHTDMGSSDTALDNFHLVVEDVSEEFMCYGPESSSAYCDMKGESDDFDSSVVNLIDEQELSSRFFKLEKSHSSGPKRDVEKGNTEITVQVLDKELDRSESCSEQTSAHDGGVTHASSHLDHPSDQSFTENHILPSIISERASLSPQFTDCSNKAPIEQREEGTEELSNITVEDIQHDVDIREVKHHDSPSSSQQVNSGAEDVSSSHSSLELQVMGAVQQSPQEPDSLSERCEPMVEKAIVECVCSQPPNLMNDHGGMIPCLLNERSTPTKPSIAPTKDCQGEGITDKKKDLSASRPCNTKKTTRRLLPVAAMMLKEFTGPDMDVDAKREEKVKSSSEAGGRSDKLIRLLNTRARPVPVHKA